MLLLWVHLQALRDALQQLATYTHIAFISRNSIYAVFEALEVLYGNHALEQLLASRVQCCALGADAEQLYQRGVQNVLKPPEVGNGVILLEGMRAYRLGAGIPQSSATPAEITEHQQMAC